MTDRTTNSNTVSGDSTPPTPNSGSNAPQLKGLMYGVGCYVLWGLFPFYWKLLSSVSDLEIFAHRMLWSFVFMFLFVVFIRRSSIKSLLRDKRAILILGAASVLIAGNWFTYIYAVNSDHIVEAALGYYINPLFSIIAGVVVFKERLTLIQKIATGLAALGVIYFTINYGSFPFITIILATTFAVYGVLKKKGGYPAAEALTVESLFLAPLALILIVIIFFMPDRVFLADIHSATNLLLSGGLIFSGIITAVPLLLFALGANAVPLSWMGFIQYLNPTLSLLIGVFVYGEPFTQAHAVCFICIWIGLALVSGEVFINMRKLPQKKPPSTLQE